MFDLAGPLIDTATLAEYIDDPALRLYDTSVFLTPRPDGQGYLAESGYTQWQTAHLPGAGFLDVIKALSDTNSELPFMMPDPTRFAAAMGAAGVGDDSTVVLYNKGFPMWSTRVWWMLKSIGFERAAVLDGGYEKWQREGRSLTADVRPYPAAHLSVRPRPDLWADKAAMQSVMTHGDAVTLNALAPAVYSGEKNQYGRPGHLPGTHNVYYGSLIDPSDGTFLPSSALAPLFEASRALAAERVVCYCGGGISATMDALALELCGQRAVAIYDGSMSEWVRDPALPLTLGSQP